MKNKRDLFRWLFWLYFIGLILVAILPLNATEELNDMNIVEVRGDYFFHVLVFLPWALLGFLAFRLSFLWIVAGLMIAAATEGLQYFLHYRAFNINDMIANVTGVVIGLVVFLIIAKRMKLKLSS